MQLCNKLQGYTQNRIQTFRQHGKKIPTNLKTKPEEKKKTQYVIQGQKENVKITAK